MSKKYDNPNLEGSPITNPNVNSKSLSSFHRRNLSKSPKNTYSGNTSVCRAGKNKLKEFF